MIIIKEKVKDLPTIIFLMIFNFWAGTLCPGPIWQPIKKEQCFALLSFCSRSFGGFGVPKSIKTLIESRVYSIHAGFEIQRFLKVTSKYKKFNKKCPWPFGLHKAGKWNLTQSGSNPWRESEYVNWFDDLDPSVGTLWLCLIVWKSVN